MKNLLVDLTAINVLTLFGRKLYYLFSDNKKALELIQDFIKRKNAPNLTIRNAALIHIM